MTKQIGGLCTCTVTRDLFSLGSTDICDANEGHRHFRKQHHGAEMEINHPHVPPFSIEQDSALQSRRGRT